MRFFIYCILHNGKERKKKKTLKIAVVCTFDALSSSLSLLKMHLLLIACIELPVKYKRDKGSSGGGRRRPFDERNLWNNTNANELDRILSIVLILSAS